MYRGNNEYRKKAKETIANNESRTAIDELVLVGMGKESLKLLFNWINSDLKLKISKKSVVEHVTESDIPEEIKQLLRGIRSSYQ